MELYFTNRRRALAVGEVPGIERAELSDLFGRRLALDGTPVLLDLGMRPVEPVSSWFRHLALMGRSVKTMRKYAYVALRLSEFLSQAGTDLMSATETDLLEYRALRTREQPEPIAKTTWEAEATAINRLYAWLVAEGYVAARPWRGDGSRDSLRNSVTRDLRVRHMTLEQYQYFRDVGLAGQLPDGSVDRSFRGRSPHRSRAGAELGLLTGMRLGEWSTLLLPELDLDGARPREGVEIQLAACAKFGRSRTVYAPRAALELVRTYLLLERRHVVTAAQATLAKRRPDLFLVDADQDGRGKLRGVLEGRRVTRTIRHMPPELRAITVMDTGDGLEPLAVFVGLGGTMPHPSTWDKIRWRAWERMRLHAADLAAPIMPTQPWLFHDLRHTFALQLLRFLMLRAAQDGAQSGMPMSTLADHIAYNPLLIVQRRLGHASPATTYIYLRYLKDPMREVDEAFAAWAAQDELTYAEIGRELLTRGTEEGSGDATQR
ncbi:tyrosine-type recombinase/integrase [Amycolatopsis sp. lyj-23]|uniref:tyrosine-type recombinase/integrase n=1 Tax=Amycolatopsis sp. lyj-23 TaxID=2789283 RepID=UPI003979B529